MLSAAGPPHTELAGRCLGKVTSMIWDRKDTGSLKRCNGQCVFRWYLRESLGWLDFSSSILGDGYKYSADKDGILDVDDKQFQGMVTVLVGMFSDTCVPMGVKSKDKIQKTQVRVLALSPALPVLLSQTHF